MPLQPIELFKPATSKKGTLQLALFGISNAGKTYSALELATGFGGKIAVIDTENYSSSFYHNFFKFDIAELTAPYTPAKYTMLINKAYQQKYDVLIIDSLTHAWAGAGGALAMHQTATAASASKNAYIAWRSVTPEHNDLVDAILHTPIHVIATLRMKTIYEQVDTNGKKSITKIGTSPIQREGVEYEFSLVWELGADHVATVVKSRLLDKDRKPIWPATRAEVLTAEHGRELREWLLT